MEKKVEVGQKVRIIAGYDDYHGFKTGDVVEVIRDAGSGNIIAKGTIAWVGSKTGPGSQYLQPHHYEAVPVVDFTQPVFTAEGTLVQIVTTTGRDQKFPVLGYEGKAKILSKFTLDGKNKNRVARRHLTNTQVAVDTEAKETFVNVYDRFQFVDAFGTVNHVGGGLGNGRFGSEAEATAAYKKNRQRDRRHPQRVGVAKLTMVKGRLPQ